MDGFKRHVNDSLQRRLSFGLSVAIVLVAVLAGGFSFVSAFHEANALQDNTLQQVAALFDRQPLTSADDATASGADEETRVVVQHLSDGARAYAQDGQSGLGDTGSILPLRGDLADGMQTIDIEGEGFRVLVKTTRLGERIAVAQETGVRDGIAREGALRTALPLMALVPLLLVLVAGLIQKMFVPIAALSAQLDQRPSEDLRAIATDNLPAEVRPFAAAINRLLGRVELAVKAQRRFVADAAHELRSPLTALSLQAERLAQLPSTPEATDRLDTLRSGIERGSRLLEQMLTLARTQESSSPPQSSVSVEHIYRRVLEDMAPLAQAKDIDIGLTAGIQWNGMVVRAHEIDLITLMHNLVENAVRYTPPDGKIDLCAHRLHSAIVLQIDDSGPGIAPTDRLRVFDPFYRLLGQESTGSGLGLSIVQAIVQRLGGTISLDYVEPDVPAGLRVQVHIPT